MTYNPYRSRLQKVQEQRSLRRSILFVFLSIGIVGLLIAIGIPLLTGITSLFGNNSSGNTALDNIPPAPPQLVVPFSATNSATLVLKGRTEPGATVYVTRNSSSIGNKTADEKGEFVLEDIALIDGANQFAAVSVDPSGNKSSQSAPVAVFYSTTIPKLELSQPTDGQVVNGVNTSFEIKGLTDPGNRVTINDRFLILNSQGNFSSIVQLQPGDNNFVIVTTNSVGNFTKKEVKIVYQP